MFKVDLDNRKLVEKKERKRKKTPVDCNGSVKGQSSSPCRYKLVVVLEIQ